MEYVLGQGRSSVQKHTLGTVRDHILLSRTENNYKSSFGACDHDEVVKHMSNLPAFLQQVEKQYSVQDKALNFGVLNWKHLEKWNYNERMPGIHHNRSSSSVSNFYCSVSGPQETGVNQRRQPAPPRSHRSHSSKEGTNANTHQKERKYVDGTKSKGKEICSQEFAVSQNSPIRSQQDNIHRKVKVHNRSCSLTNVPNRKDPMNEVTLEKEASSSESGMHKLPRPSLEEIFNDDVDFTSQCFHRDRQSIKIRDSIDLDICTSPRPGMHSEGKVSTVHEKTRRPSFSAFYNTQDEISEQPIVKGRHLYPSRRFSFDLGRMSRNCSFKESSEITESSSTHSTTVNSSPLSPEVSSVTNNFEKHKANATARGRSSRLTRLLSPFMKHKVDQTERSYRLANGSLNSYTVIPKGSTSKALLQLTLKNGIPSFKLVVENSGDMLAAVVNNLSGSGKVDPCIIYEFYSVHETKKKGMNWMNQGSRSKNCSLGHQIVGRMKISNSSVARECVLYGVDEQNPDFLLNKEVAAVVVMNSRENLINEDLNVTMGTERCQNSSDMVVILPGGPHGVPVEGTHSSLISRWRSGGSCDCGGWDEGCQLRILSIHKEGCELVSSSASDSVDLVVQGGESKKPVFSLKPLNNGLYSIELDASVSLLEAFATCVAYGTCRKFSDILITKYQPNEEHFPKFVSCPPLSPAGRS